jgi:SAM-dependent methyltransferase
MAQPLEHHLAGQIDRRPGFWHEVRARAVTGQVPTGVSSTVADLGAGGGQLAQILARDRPLARYRFHEPLDALSDVLVARHGEGARLGPHDELDVDLVALLDVIEHVEDDGRLVAQVVSRSRPGTTIVITVPAFAWLWSSWDEGLGHFRRYTKQQLSAVAEHLPLEISESATCSRSSSSPRCSGRRGGSSGDARTRWRSTSSNCPGRSTDSLAGSGC